MTEDPAADGVVDDVGEQSGAEEPEATALADARHPDHRRPPVGYAVRRPTDDDVRRIAVMYERAAVRASDGSAGRGALRTEADLRRTWDARRDDALVVVDERTGDVAGYLEFHESIDPWTPALELYTEGRVAQEADGVASFLLERARARAARAARRSPGLPATLRTTVVDPSTDLLAWYAEAGLEPERHLLALRIDLGEGTPAPVWPDGLRAVVATEVDQEAVHATLVAAFADHHLGATDDIEDWRAVRLRTGRVDLSASLVALDGDVPVGVALGRVGTGDDPGLATITDLGVVPPHRGRGIATALLRASFRHVAARGAVRVGLKVDDVTLDGALRLYRRAGMEVVHHAIVLRSPPITA